MKIPEKEDLQFLTGVENSQLFMWLLDVIVQHFGYENHLFIVLMKLKLGLLNRDLVIRFNLNETKVSKVFQK